MARVQSPVPVIPPNLRDYLGGYTASAFRSGVVDNATNQAFNDQVVAIGAADLMPALEAAIAKRIERDVIPELKRVYATPTWGLSAEHAVHPFAAPFGDPGTSSFRGAAGALQGLLPSTRLWAAAGRAVCPRSSATRRRPRTPPRCSATGHRIANLRLGKSGRAAVRRAIRKKRARTVAARPYRDERHFHERRNGLRALDPEKLEVSARSNALLDPWQPQPVTYFAEMNDGSIADKPAGSVTVTFGAMLPNIDAMGWGSSAQFRIRIDRAVIGDHALLDPLAPVSGWFVRNEWYRLLYYVLTPSHAASGPAALVQQLSARRESRPLRQAARHPDPRRPQPRRQPAAEWRARRFPRGRQRRSRPEFRAACGEFRLQRSHRGRGRKPVRSARRGFTLTELAVVLAIIASCSARRCSVSAHISKRGTATTRSAG